jgi:uncharacterized protein
MDGYNSSVSGWDLSRFKWLNPPPSFVVEGTALHVTTGDKTDFWQGTYYGFHRDDAHGLLTEAKGEFTAELTFGGAYETLYDQAGLLVRADAKKWMKCGVEFSDGAPKFSVVVTNGVSDWSTLSLTLDEANSVSVRVTRMKDALFVQFKAGERDWAMARLAAFPDALEILGVGPFCCSPQRAGFEARFHNFTVSDIASRDIH